MIVHTGRDNLYHLNVTDVEKLCRLCDHELFEVNNLSTDQILITDAKPEDITELLHSRLGHFYLNPFVRAYNLGRLNGLDAYINKIRENHFYKYCATCKLAVQPFQGSHNMDNNAYGQYIYSDICGLFRVKSRSCMQYLVRYIDGATREGYVAFMQISCFEYYLDHYIRLRKKTIGVLFSNNGGKYVSDSFIAFCHENGIDSIRSSPYSHQKNGIAERYNRTIVEAVRTTLLESGLPPSLFAEPVNTANEIKNLLPHSAIENMVTPFELVHGTIPDLSNIATSA